MKSIKIMVAALAAYGLTACCCNEPKQLSGFITDATMNTVTVKALTGDETYTFSTEEADKAEANGLLLGAPVTVDYKGKLEGVVPATKVATDPTYAEAIGSWTMPDPLNPDSLKMGVQLMVEGAAQSINMATLPYSNWELQGEAGKVILKGQSIGNGITSDVTNIGTISKNAEGVYTMAIEGTDVVYSKLAE